MRTDKLEGITGDVRNTLIATNIVYPCIVIGIGKIFARNIEQLQVLLRSKHESDKVAVYVKSRDSEGVRRRFLGYVPLTPLLRFITQGISSDLDMTFRYIWYSDELQSYQYYDNMLILAYFTDLESQLR